MIFVNGRVVLPNGVRENVSVKIQNGMITEISEAEQISTDGENVYDLKGDYLLPGFIDVHCHGGNGHDFMDANHEAFYQIAKFHRSHGTTMMYATSLSGTFEETKQFLDTFETYDNAKDACVLEGVHLEGPNFAMSQRGAQDPKYIVDPNPEHYKALSDFNSVKRWSIAPERPGAYEMAKYLKSKGILSSVAHSEALYEVCEEALKYGFNAMTHLYSGMLGVTRINAYRHGGAVEAGLLLDDYYCEIIGDGSHLPVELLKLVLKCKPINKIVGITDSMRGSGLKPGSKTKLGSLTNGQTVNITDDVAMMPDGLSFAGSTATMDRVFRVLVEQVGLDVAIASRILSANPAELMMVHEKTGSLEVGKRADLIVMNHEHSVINTFVSENFVN